MTPVEVQDNPSRNRYEALSDGRVAGFAEYRRSGDDIIFTHTIVSPSFEGQGVGGQLARSVLDSAVEAGLSIVPQCSFIAGYIKSHPQYLQHVDEALRSRLT